MHRRRRNAGLIAVAVVVAGGMLSVTSGGSSPTAHEARAQPIVAGTPSPPQRPTATTTHRPPRSHAPTPVRAHHAAQSASADVDLGVGSVGGVVNHVLRYTSYVQLAGHRRREVALTFDDGPSPYTHDVLRVLNRMHARATFFVVGREVAIVQAARRRRGPRG